jgi:uncharacterized protein
MSLADELQKLQQLYQSGALSNEEYTKAKARLLESPLPDGPWAATSPISAEEQTRQWALFLHLSQLIGLFVPLAGLIAPILIWQIKKTELPGIDAHGKIVVNWMISEILYFVVCVILVFVIVGIPLLIALCVTAIVFPIVGGIKANNGEVWKYPMSIKFFK